MAKNAIRNVKECQKEFLKLFDGFSGKQSRWQIWSDFIVLSACAISNQVDEAHAEKREELYMTTLSKYDDREKQLFPKLFAAVVDGMEREPDQDFLGELYMACELGNDHAGQFFTPYSVCQAMAAMTISDAAEKIEREGFIAANDPACGAGALLVAFANECHKKNIDYQGHVLFTAQDLDYTVGLMCYIQLTLMGCAGYVTIGNTLTNPQTSYDRKCLFPVDEEGNVWYTPMYFSDIWHWRRVWNLADMVVAKACVTAAVEAESAENTPLEVPAPPEIIEEPDTEVAPVYAEAEAGQLTLF